jgi:TRAP-type transport system periplasmic protein
MPKRFSIILLAGLVLCLNLNAKTSIKFAVIAPEGSTWMVMMHDFDKEIQTASKGELEFKIFPGGVSGDEIDVIRKMKMNKINSAGFTGVGLGQILPQVRIMELPLMFSSYEEVDYITEKLQPYFEAEFQKNGYVLLGWAEVGFVNIFSNKKIDTMKAMEGVKMWAWEGDPLVKTMFETMKVVPNPLAVTDVFTSLQTGLIDAVYISPLGAIAMQWFSKTKYMTDVKLADATGAVLMEKKFFDKLSPANQTMLRTRFKAFCKKLITASRKDNAKAYDTLKKNNIETVHFIDNASLEDISKKVWNSLVGKLYSKSLLDEVIKYKNDFRKNSK